MTKDNGNAQPRSAEVEQACRAQLEIRAVARPDIGNLIELCRQHAAYEGSEYVETDQPSRLEHALFDARPSLYGWLVVQKGEACGFMTATIDFATWTARPFVHMDCLYLREHVRRLGAGRALISALRQFAKQNDCDLIQWQTPVDNELGIRFYDRIGAMSKSKLRFFLSL
jgi:ribosomal protein S18 acetylase RimI-like enzyme